MSEDGPVSEGFPFVLSNPRLLSNKVRSQVFSCDYTRVEDTTRSACIVKLYSSRHTAAYERELAIYNLVRDFDAPPIPSKLWSGVWDGVRYREFLGGQFPSLGRGEVRVKVIVLAYTEDFDVFRREDLPEAVQQQAAKAALLALRKLHTLGIVHGDISRNNILIHGKTPHYDATLVDFASSVANASQDAMSHEWDKAVEYFTDLVLPF